MTSKGGGYPGSGGGGEFHKCVETNTHGPGEDKRKREKKKKKTFSMKGVML